MPYVKPSVARSCELCGFEFQARISDVRKGCGRFCSKSCSGSVAGKRARLLHPFNGDKNPNWRGGPETNPYQRWIKPYKQAHPERKKAHAAVYEAVKAGHLVRPSVCSLCPRTLNIQAHHVDYSRPLDVQWLCKPCHARADQALAAASRRASGPAASRPASALASVPCDGVSQTSATSV
jgi:hypothetical protein